MIIEDKELLGEFTLKPIMDDKVEVYEPGNGNGEMKHAVTCKNITDAMLYVMRRRMISMDKKLTLSEYFKFVEDYLREFNATSAAKKAGVSNEAVPMSS